MAHFIHYIMDLLILFRNDSTVWKESVWIPIHAATDWMNKYYVSQYKVNVKYLT